MERMGIYMAVEVAGTVAAEMEGDSAAVAVPMVKPVTGELMVEVEEVMKHQEKLGMEVLAVEVAGAVVAVFPELVRGVGLEVLAEEGVAAGGAYMRDPAACWGGRVVIPIR